MPVRFFGEKNMYFPITIRKIVGREIKKLPQNVRIKSGMCKIKVQDFITFMTFRNNGYFPRFFGKSVKLTKDLRVKTDVKTAG